MTNLTQLPALSQEKLDQLYGSASVGLIPIGTSRGMALLAPGNPINRLLSWIAWLVWQGKIIKAGSAPNQASMINRVLGLRAVRAKVYLGPSWFDSKPAIIIDYSETSWACRAVRDEIRHVGPGLFLGRAYLRTRSQPRFLVNFAVDFNDSKSK